MEIPGYKILRQLGRGGMATVYLALQESVEREVALKVMSPFLLTDPTFGERFLREARIAARMTHRHIVQVHDVGRAGDHHYIAMEYLSEGELIGKEGRGLDVLSVLRATKEIASALGYAHAKGFVHRDVKPDNILKRDDGAAVLTDFGIARAADSQTHMTKTGSVIGTPHYMSPEQARGRAVDGRADLYSLGVVFHEMLLGRVPYSADDSLAVGIMHITQPIPGLPTHLAMFQPLLNQLLAKAPEDRFQTGDAVVDEIEALELRMHAGEFPNLIESVTLTRVRVSTPMARTKPATPTTRTEQRIEPTMGEIGELPSAPRPIAAPARTGGSLWAVVAFALLGALAAIYVFRTPLLAALQGTPTNIALPTPVVDPVPEPEIKPLPPPKQFPAASTLLPKINAAIAERKLINGADSALALLQAAKARSPQPSDLIEATQLLEAALEVELARSAEESKTSALIEAWQSIAPASSALAEAKASRAKAALAAQLEPKLSAAQAARKAGRLIGANSADAALQSAAQLAPAAAEVIAEQRLLAAEMVRRAARFLEDRELDRAAPLLARAQVWDPTATGLLAAKKKLETLRTAADSSALPPIQDAVQQAQIATLLSEAQVHITKGELNAPPVDNAFDKFKSVLRIDPKNAVAQAGLKNLPQRFQALFDQALDAGDVVKADEYFGGLSDLGLGSTALAIQRERLVEAYAVALAKARAENRETRAKNYAERLLQLAPGDPRAL